MHREDLVEARRGAGTDPYEHFAPILVGVHAVELAGAGDALEDGEVVPALCVADEGEVLPSECTSNGVRLPPPTRWQTSAGRQGWLVQRGTTKASRSPVSTLQRSARADTNRCPLNGYSAAERTSPASPPNPLRKSAGVPDR